MARPFIPVPGVFKVQLIFSLFSQRIENVLNVKSGGGVTSTDADRIEAVFASWWTNTYRTNLSNQLSLVLIVLDALNAENSLHKEYTSGWTVTGGVVSNSMPGGVTTSVKHTTGLRGRSFRGRSYVPGLPTGVVANGLVTTTFRDQMQAAFNTLRTNLAAGSPSDKLVIVSYRADGQWRAQGLATEVTSSSAHLLVDSQRRRLIGRGL